MVSRLTTKIYFIFQDSNGQQKIFEVDPSFAWNRKFEVRDDKGYRFYLPETVTGPLNMPDASEMQDMRVDKNGVIRYRFEISTDLDRRITNNILQHSEDDSDWWLLTKPGMIPHQPIRNVQPNTNQNPPIQNTTPNNSQVIDLTNLSTFIPTIARIGFVRSQTNNSILRIEIVYP
jgi:hypothetical protein